MKKETLRNLRDEQKRRINSAAEKLLDKDDINGSKNDLDWVEMSSTLISSKERGSKLRWTVLVTLFSIIIISLAWVIRIPKVDVSIDVVTSNVGFTLSDEWSPDLKRPIDKIFINKLTKVLSPKLGSEIHDQQNRTASFILEGTNLTFNNLQLANGASVELKQYVDDLQIFVKHSSVEGYINIQDAELTVTKPDRSVLEQDFNEDPPEYLKFVTSRETSTPVSLTLKTKDWEFSNIDVQNIKFTDERVPDSGEIKSAIKSGTVQILQTGLEYDLHKTDYLVLVNPDTKRIEVSRDNNAINVFFEGKVDDILLGPDGFEKNLKPSWFEYIYHQKPIAIFWTAVVFIFGILWRIYDTIFA